MFRPANRSFLDTPIYAAEDILGFEARVGSVRRPFETEADAAQWISTCGLLGSTEISVILRSGWAERCTWLDRNGIEVRDLEDLYASDPWDNSTCARDTMWVLDVYQMNQLDRHEPVRVTFNDFDLVDL